MTTRLISGTLLLLAAPSIALAASEAFSRRLETGGVALAGLVAALAWHQLAAHRGELADRWHQLHLAGRWHGVHLGATVAARLHLPRSRRTHH